MFGEKWFAIVNPASANGRTQRLWPHLLKEICAEGWQVEYAHTTNQGDGIRLAAQALQQGFTKILVVGGDGTVNEVINGLFVHGFNSNEVELAILSQGTGGDFLRSFDIPKGITFFLEVLKRSRIQKIDVGKVTYMNSTKPLARWFL